MTSPGRHTTPHHRRARLQPSRSMPMASRRSQAPSPTSTPRATRSVVHVSRRSITRDTPGVGGAVARAYSGKGVISAMSSSAAATSTGLGSVGMTSTGTPNPYSSRGIVSVMRSPTRSGKTPIQLTRGGSSRGLGGEGTAVPDLQPKMPKAVYQRARKDSDFDKNMVSPSMIMTPSLNSKCSDADLHSSWKKFSNAYDPHTSEFQQIEETDSNDKARRGLTSYGILKSIFKAATLLALGFGGGYVYSNHVVGAASAQSRNAKNLLDTDKYSPWGYSPADPVIQKLLQHNKHEDVIGDIKSMKFPGRTPHEEPMLPGELNPGGAEEGDSWEHMRDPASIVNPDSIKSLDANKKAKAATDASQQPPGENEAIINPKDSSEQQFKFRHSKIQLRGAPGTEDASAAPGDQQQQGADGKDWNPQEEKLVHLVNRSARKIRLFWIPHGFIASQDQWVPMSDPWIDDGQDFYLHARPTHNFAVLEEPLPANGAIALEFTVANQEKQKITVYDNWKIEAEDEEKPEPAASGNAGNAAANENSGTASPIIHENPKEQHAPPEYMNRQQNSEQYWAEHAQKEAQQQQRLLETENPPGAGQAAERAARDQQAQEQQERQAREQAEQQAQQEAQAREQAEREQQQQQQQQQVVQQEQQGEILQGQQ